MNITLGGRIGGDLAKSSSSKCNGTQFCWNMEMCIIEKLNVSLFYNEHWIYYYNLKSDKAIVIPQKLDTRDELEKSKI